MEVSGRRRPTLSEHMMGDSSALHDGRSTLAGLTLAAVLSGEGRNQSHRRPSSTAAATTRTLLDIIKEEQASSATVYGGLVSHPQNKKSWKSFRDLLRHRRDAAATDESSASSSGAASFSAVAHEIHQISRSSDPIPVLIPPESTSEVEAGAPVAMRLSAALEAEREAAAAPEGPRVSLMSLLERREVGPEAGSEVGPEAVSEVGPAVGPTGEEGEGEGGDDVAGGGGGEGVRECVCCVCMVRHKGAAFIPCGHTFCRLCSRELWVSRGNCPLCNGYILEILDIF